VSDATNVSAVGASGFVRMPPTWAVDVRIANRCNALSAWNDEERRTKPQVANFREATEI
jgi:hypothetical protein